MFDVPATLSDNLTKGCLPFLLAGGQGSRLHELTAHECKPAVHFADAGRIVDFVMSGVHRAGFDEMLVATQYKPNTLTRHMKTAWAGGFAKGLHLRDGAKIANQQGYRGTADAVMANLAEVDRINPKEVLILAADHVYDMDFTAMLEAHRASGAMATLAATPVPRMEATGFGVLAINGSNRCVEFAEKPKDPAAMSGRSDMALASMGIYVFDWEWLRDAMMEAFKREDTSHDFGHDIMPMALAQDTLNVYALPDSDDGNPGYWRDVGTLDAYRLALLDFENGSPIRLPKAPGQAYFKPADMTSASSTIEESVVLPGASVGSNCRLSKTIVGAGTEVPSGLVIGEDHDEDARWFRRTDGGTTLVTSEMLARRADQRTLMHPMSSQRPHSHFASQ
ncbi:sugar phosphate nucleotidyltransferase [Marivivens aquimaris]|uniref:sugar phosphate nucleotidyltransferase n=1 Tax=Marivivens aquimaris TaxID=2774876 RepID=UPI00187F2410|nr:sugar phosphate nucleotidyltransferase [Marivivens aquimaris]